jgi:hypothetical protein
MAIPRLRPLDRLPASFGRDWTLMPPHISLRAELHALYAAVSRTFCLSAATFRSLCRWEPQRASASASAPVDGGGFGSGPSVTRAAGDSNSASTHAGQYSSSRLWAALAGGTCVLGGAAVLAWIAFHHAAPSASSGVRATASTSAIGDIHLTPATTPVAAPITPPAKAAAMTPASPPAASTRIDHPQARNTRHHNRTRQPHREAVRVQRNTQPSVSSLRTRVVTAVEVPAPSARPFAKPSSAGDFSPFAPPALGVDEYASIRMSANTHLRSNVSPARTQPQPANIDSTDWTNHVSQRRVTDVPEQFVK